MELREFETMNHMTLIAIAALALSACGGASDTPDASPKATDTTTSDTQPESLLSGGHAAKRN